ncbi:MAG TPA: sialate O-acetylesterase [Pseudoduganella sp.]|jgi:sialate O-acetylesterase
MLFPTPCPTPCRARTHGTIPLAATLLLAAMSAGAAVRLPAILSDHMVLQRSATTPVWGWADAGEAVSVRFGDATATARAGADGRWRVDLDLTKSAGTDELSVRGASGEIVVRDVLVGDIWLASGQSNMQKPLGERKGERPTFNYREEIEAAEAPDLRLFKVARRRAPQPADDVAGEWVRCSPASVERSAFSAAAYFFGRRLHRELGVPVGLIDTSYGGTRIELWTPAAALAAAPDRQPAADDAVLYNGMVAGLAPFALKGVLWYQGESNLIEDGGAAYTAKMAALVGSWRQAFGAGAPARRLPFYYVQIAPHLYHVVRSAKVADPEAAARLRAAQAAALAIPGTGMVATSDLADDLADIHPRDKRTVGLRLANLALADTYGRRDLAAQGPQWRAMTIDGGRALLSFDHAQGLFASDRKALSWFQVAGTDGRWHPAQAVIERDRVAVRSDRVPQPARVRFAWDEAAQPNLVNSAGLPALPFSTDEPVSAAVR